LLQPISALMSQQHREQPVSHFKSNGFLATGTDYLTPYHSVDLRIKTLVDLDVKHQETFYEPEDLLHDDEVCSLLPGTHRLFRHQSQRGVAVS